MVYILGIDIGTSGTKTALFDYKGNVKASYTEEYELLSPSNGYAEQHPEDWWNATVHGIKEVIYKTGINSADIKGIGLSGQMHGLVMLDEKNEVIRNAIIWCDQRTAKECDEITEKVGKERLIEITANPALTGFTASKILWVKNNEPRNYERCKHILLPKDYIRFKLTGEYATEVSDASGMQLLDIKNRCWSDEVLSKLGIDKNLLGKVYESPDVTGEITQQVADITGLTKGTIVAGGAGDNAAAAVGTGVVEDGRAFTTIGTSGVVFVHTSKMVIDPLGRVHTFCAAVPNSWHVMGVTQAAGLSLKWFKDNFCHEEMEISKNTNKYIYDITDDLARNVPIGSDKLLYLPYLMGERTPHLDPYARGVFMGLSAIHNKSNMIRAILEGVSFSLNDCKSVFAEMGIFFDDMMVCGGGAKSDLWRQMLADIYSTPVTTLGSSEGPAMGVAILAAVASGVYKNVSEACTEIVKKDITQKPILENTELYNKYYNVYKKVYLDLKDTYKTLNSL